MTVGPNTQSQLVQLETTGLIRVAQVEPELAYLFRHALVQEAAYASLLKADRKRLHLAVGEALERMYPDRLASRELAPVLAEHFCQAGDDRRALKYFTLAGDAAFGVYANAEAVSHYTRALDIARRDRMNSLSSEQLGHLYSCRGRALELNAQYERALDNYDEMTAMARERGDRTLELAARVAHASVHATPNPTFDAAQGHALAEQALALARELGDRPTEARIHWILLRLNYWAGDMPRSLEYGARALTLARELNLREQLAFTLHDIHRSYSGNSQPERARAALDEARQLWRELGNLPMLADALASDADINFSAGDYERALASAQEAFRISQPIGNVWGQAYSRMMVGHVYLERGELGQAIEAMEDAIRLSELAGLVVLAPRVCVRLGWAYETLGALERGRQVLHQALAKIKASDPVHYIARARLTAMLAYMDILDGNLARAESAIRQSYAAVHACAQVRRLARPIMLTTLYLADGELALATQDYERAVVLADELLARLHEEGARCDLAYALRLKGQALLAQGRIEAAREVLTEARREAEAIGARRSLWPILATLSQLEVGRGQHAEAHLLCRQTREVVEYIAAHAPTSELRASFLNQPHVRAVMETR